MRDRTDATPHQSDERQAERILYVRGRGGGVPRLARVQVAREVYRPIREVRGRGLYAPVPSSGLDRAGAMRRSCRVCGGAAVSARRALTYRGVPLGSRVACLCSSCGEVVFRNDVWRAMRRVDRLLALPSATTKTVTNLTGATGVSIVGGAASFGSITQDLLWPAITTSVRRAPRARTAVTGPSRRTAEAILAAS